MAHGVKPYGRTQAQETIFGMQDMGELAARLKSIDTHDRRGDIVWLDDFESGVDNFHHFITFVADTVTWDTTTARSGAFCAKLHASNNPGSDAAMFRYLAYPALGRMGLEFSFATPHNTQNIVGTMYFDNGVRYYEGSLLYRVGTEDLSVRDAGGVWQLIDGNREIQRDLHAWNTVKLVVDFAALQYVRLIFNEHEYDIAPYAPRDVGASVVPRLQVEIWNSYIVAGAADTYVDDVIVTQNEP